MELVKTFFKDENFEKAELFFIYLTTHCDHKRAYMIPNLFNKVVSVINEKTKEKSETIKTEVLAWFKNWVEEADMLGQDQGEEKHDTELLYKILSILNPNKKIIIISNKYNESGVTSLPIDNLFGYLMNKPDFAAYLSKNYGVNDGASY